MVSALQSPPLILLENTCSFMRMTVKMQDNSASGWKNHKWKQKLPLRLMHVQLSLRDRAYASSPPDLCITCRQSKWKAPKDGIRPTQRVAIYLESNLWWRTCQSWISWWVWSQVPQWKEYHKPKQNSSLRMLVLRVSYPYLLSYSFYGLQAINENQREGVAFLQGPH